MLRRVDRVILRVFSVPGAVSYYRDVLGLTLVRDDGRVASFKLAEGDTELIVHADPELPAEAVYYRVDNVRELYERRAALKLRFSKPPIAATHGYRAEVKDPFGNVLRLLDRSTDQAAGRRGRLPLKTADRRDRFSPALSRLFPPDGRPSSACMSSSAAPRTIFRTPRILKRFIPTTAPTTRISNPPARKSGGTC